jgi:hypothetical protein
MLLIPRVKNEYPRMARLMRWWPLGWWVQGHAYFHPIRSSFPPSSASSCNPLGKQLPLVSNLFFCNQSFHPAPAPVAARSKGL